MVHQASEAAPLCRALRATLRAEDALFRIDGLTVAALLPVSDPRALPGLLTRLSWRLSPADPAALATGSAVWAPGQEVEGVVATAWARLLAALGMARAGD
jgi:hypothetical protein